VSPTIAQVMGLGEKNQIAGGAADGAVGEKPAVETQAAVTAKSAVGRRVAPAAPKASLGADVAAERLEEQTQPEAHVRGRGHGSPPPTGGRGRGTSPAAEKMGTVALQSLDDMWREADKNRKAYCVSSQRSGQLCERVEAEAKGFSWLKTSPIYAGHVALQRDTIALMNDFGRELMLCEPKQMKLMKSKIPEEEQKVQIATFNAAATKFAALEASSAALLTIKANAEALSQGG
jgi:hypothetical protein